MFKVLNVVDCDTPRLRCRARIILEHQNALKQAVGDRQYYYYKMITENIYQWITYYKIISTGSYYDHNEHRDTYMAKTLQYLIDSRYEGEKIIVWAASGHNARNTADIEAETKYTNMKWMGNYLYEWYGDQIYSIATLAYKGEREWVYGWYYTEIPEATYGSLEWYLNKVGYKWGFLDLKNHKGNPWINNKISSRVFDGYTYDNAEWKTVFDGIFFLREEHKALPMDE